jgi:acyl-CoA reductase-like NAD-dependent aldehyde dehydrogenase
MPMPLVHPSVANLSGHPPSMNSTAVDRPPLLHDAARVTMVAMESNSQAKWAALPIKERLRVLRRMRHLLAERLTALTDAIPTTLARNRADTLASEVLPLLVACRFLEREAPRILKTRHLGRAGLPLWLPGVISSVERVPFGTVLVIGPSNYPLFIPGVQVLQALAAGNAAVWKPGVGGAPVATAVAEALMDAGLPAGLLRVTGESVQEGIKELTTGVDKVIFTGSAGAGHTVLHAAADSATPVTVELSGCDAVIVLPSGEPARVVAALAFGMRLNGSSTCMAPRRLMLIGSGHDGLIALLKERFAQMEGILIREPVRTQIKELMEDASVHGATVCGDPRAVWMKPLLVLNGHSAMRVAQSDVFAPVLTVMQFKDTEEMLRADARCPFGLTASIFGEERQARAIGQQMKVGTVVINDLMVPTVDPRVPFGGRKQTGFGTTRGAEGLLEMTAAKATLVRRGNATWHYDPTGECHETMFRGLTELTHGQGLWRKINGLRTMVAGARRLQREKA